MSSTSHDAREPRGFVAWLEKRLPVRELIESQLTGYYGLDAGAHRTGVVLHAVLRHPARNSRSAPRCAADAVGRRVVPVPPLARSFAGPIDSLQGLAVAILSRDVRGFLRCAGLPRSAARGRKICVAGASVCSRPIAYELGLARARRHAAGLSPTIRRKRRVRCA